MLIHPTCRALVRGAEMRVAETRAVNRALRKAYGIGICSVEELGSIPQPAQSARESRSSRPQPVNGNCGGPKVRDRLCQLIRQHKLDADLVKSYATDFCAVKTLRDATREQVENFVQHLADWAEKDRDALLCQLNVISGQRKVPHEAPYSRFARSRSVCWRRDPEWDVPRSCGPCSRPVARTQAPTTSPAFAVLDLWELAGQSITGRIYLTPKALWKLSWFLRDFGYDPS